MLLTDFHGYDNMRDDFGWCLVFILGVTVGVNFLRLAWKTLEAFIYGIKKMRQIMQTKFGWLKPSDTVAIKPGTEHHSTFLTQGSLKTVAPTANGRTPKPSHDQSLERDVHALRNIFEGTKTPNDLIKEVLQAEHLFQNKPLNPDNTKVHEVMFNQNKRLAQRDIEGSDVVESKQIVEARHHQVD